jgi:uncharacterized protein with PIN domain
VPRLRLRKKSLKKEQSNKIRDMKANALLCPTCCVEYIKVEFDFEVDGIILHNVKALRCPECEEEVFTPQQYEAIRKRINNIEEP